MNVTRTRRGDRQAGQIIVIMVGGLVAMLAMVALIVDGGNAFAQQRATQNGADAAADAGALVLAQNLGATPTKTDADVRAAIQASGAANQLDSVTAYYTDVTGELLDSAGNATGTIGNAVLVGNGSIPNCNDATRCVGGKASGVRAFGHKDVGTLVAGLIGLNQIGVTTQATAVSGYLTASSGDNVLPVSVPVTIVTCDDQNNPLLEPDPYEVDQTYVIPLCKNGPGNVGWLDWTPTGGGTSELIDAILNPNNPAIPVPSWQYVTSTGNVNSAGVEDAMNSWAGQIVLIPQFDSTCNTQPAGTDEGSCPAGNVGGQGSNQWYHFPSFAAIELARPQAAWISGSNKAACDTGNGATSCIKGTFRSFITEGEVGPGAGGGLATSIVGVQLIR